MSSLSNALAILSSFDRDAPELGVTELAEKLQIPKSSISRLMSELEREGYLERTPSRRYRPGAQLLRLGSLYKFAVAPIDRIDEEMKAALKHFPASGYVTINKGISTIILRMREGQSQIRFIVPEGSIVPAYTVAVGKAVLGRMSDEDLDAQLPARVQCDMPFYDLPKRELIAELQEGRRRHYWELRDMANRGVDALASSIWPVGSDPIGFAFSFMATTPRHIKDEMLAELLRIGATLGVTLGDPYWRDFAAETRDHSEEN